MLHELLDTVGLLAESKYREVNIEFLNRNVKRTI